MPARSECEVPNVTEQAVMNQKAGQIAARRKR